MSAKLRTVEAQFKNERKAHKEKVQKMSNDYAEIAAKLSNRSEKVLCPLDMNQNFKSEAMNADYDSKLQDEVTRLKRMVAELVYSNNRYHIALSNCYCLPSVDATSDTSMSLDESISASTPLPYDVPNLVKVSVPASPASVSSALMSSTSKESSPPVKVDKKDQVFVSRMVKLLSKLEVKYSTPPHKRKRKFFARKKKQSHIIPREFSTIYHNLAAPEPDVVTIPEPYLQVHWNSVKFKPVYDLVKPLLEYI